MISCRRSGGLWARLVLAGVDGGLLAGGLAGGSRTFFGDGERDVAAHGLLAKLAKEADDGRSQSIGGGWRVSSAAATNPGSAAFDECGLLWRLSFAASFAGLGPDESHDRGRLISEAVLERDRKGLRESLN